MHTGALYPSESTQSIVVTLTTFRCLSRTLLSIYLRHFIQKAVLLHLWPGHTMKQEENAETH